MNTETMNTEIVNPNSYFAYTHQNAIDANAYPTIREGAFEFGLTDVKPGENDETRDCTFTFTLTPLDVNGKPARDVTVRDNLIVSLPNPKVPGHKVVSPTEKLSDQQWRRIQDSKAERYIRALEPSYLPVRYTYDKTEKVSRDATGEIVPKAEVAAQNQRISELVWDKLGEWYLNPSLIKGGRVYGTTKKSQSGDKTYVNIDKIMSDSGDLEIIREGFAV